MGPYNQTLFDTAVKAGKIWEKVFHFGLFLFVCLTDSLLLYFFVLFAFCIFIFFTNKAPLCNQNEMINKLTPFPYVMNNCNYFFIIEFFIASIFVYTD